MSSAVGRSGLQLAVAGLGGGQAAARRSDLLGAGPRLDFGQIFLRVPQSSFSLGDFGICGRRLQVGQGDLGGINLELGLGNGTLQGRSIKLEQQVAGLHLVADVDGDLLDDPVDAQRHAALVDQGQVPAGADGGRSQVGGLDRDGGHGGAGGA